MHRFRGFTMHMSGAFFLAAALIVPVASSAQQAKTTPEKPMEAAAGKTYTIASEGLRGYQNTQSNLAAAAEKMPEEHYGFRPTPDVKPFAQHLAHVAISQYGLCARVKGEANPKQDEKEETTRNKADTIALLKSSTAYCEPVVAGLTESSVTELVQMGPDKVMRGLIPLALISHADEVYGSVAVYLRLKGIVPPSTEKMNKMRQEQPKKSSQ